ncbi:DUF5305 family protein [Thermococcus sp.]|uniref:DUF5305 family protein n=1 Tax=Thermococcus sp. TaxID=35749 RepID=UPI002612889E|nr:DUF5305 family protein [Thermococcus sp.]
MNFRIERGRAIALLLAVSIGLAVLFGGYSAAAYLRSPTTTEVFYRTLYVERGSLSHMGFFSNETVYKNGTSLRYYPEKITREIKGAYDYATSHAGKGTYSAVLRADYYVTANKERISLKNTTVRQWKGDFSGSFSIPVDFNMTDLKGALTELREGTGLYRASSDVYLTVSVSVPGRETFTQRIKLVRNTAGMLTFEGSSKSYKKVERTVNTTVNTVNFLGKDVAVSTGRTVFPIMAFAFALPPLGFAYTKREKKPTDELKGLKKFIVEGTPSDVPGDPVELDSVGDLGRVFDLVDKPIVHHVENGEDVYSITDGQVVYEYRPGNGGVG